MATGASANDPLFWPLHPIFDRLWAYMRLSDEFDGFNHTWVNTNSCYGHDHHDILPFSDLFNEGTGHFYSNQELYQAFDPRSPVLPYVYDTFVWDHCAGNDASDTAKS
mmetsp:Transcript_2700/g.9136  ORF Transcript_2700/g.9136 Transcript_2700/m.9136 type:complete len:108 (-) Transcript_2700:70-393(-)